MTRRSAALRLTAGALAVLAACSSGGGAADPKKDAAKAAKLVLVAKDFPELYLARDHKADAAETQSRFDMAACLHLPPPGVVNDAEVVGKDFVRGLGTQAQSVRSSALYAKKASALDSDVKAARSAQFKDCLKSTSSALFTSRSPSIHIDGLIVADRAFPKHGDSTTGYRLQSNITAAQTALSVFADVVVYTKGRARVTATFTSIGSPFPDAEEARLVTILGRRLDKQS